MRIVVVKSGFYMHSSYSDLQNGNMIDPRHKWSGLDSGKTHIGLDIDFDE